MKVRELLCALTMALLAVAPPAAAAGEEIAVRLYEVHYLSMNEAALLARQRCLELGGAECEYRVKGDGFFEFFASLPTHGAIQAVLAERDIPPATQLFQVTLLIAREAPASRPALPDTAGRALDDLEDFLPFRNYTLLDTGIMRTADDVEIALGGEKGYAARLRFRGDPRRGAPLQVDFQLSQSFVRWVKPPPEAAGGSNHASPAEDSQAKEVHRAIVETSFSIDQGETVVVGTSKLDGGAEALVVLLTAAKG